MVVLYIIMCVFWGLVLILGIWMAISKIKENAIDSKGNQSRYLTPSEIQKSNINESTIQPPLIETLSENGVLGFSLNAKSYDLYKSLNERKVLSESCEYCLKLLDENENLGNNSYVIEAFKNQYMGIENICFLSINGVVTAMLLHLVKVDSSGIATKFFFDVSNKVKELNNLQMSSSSQNTVLLNEQSGTLYIGSKFGFNAEQEIDQIEKTVYSYEPIVYYPSQNESLKNKCTFLTAIGITVVLACIGVLVFMFTAPNIFGLGIWAYFLLDIALILIGCDITIESRLALKPFQVAMSNLKTPEDLSTTNYVFGHRILGDFRHTVGRGVGYEFLMFVLPLIPLGCYRTSGWTDPSFTGKKVAPKTWQTKIAISGTQKWNFWEVLSIYFRWWGIVAFLISLIGIFVNLVS